MKKSTTGLQSAIPEWTNAGAGECRDRREWHHFFLPTLRTLARGLRFPQANLVTSDLAAASVVAVSAEKIKGAPAPFRWLHLRVLYVHLHEYIIAGTICSGRNIFSVLAHQDDKIIDTPSRAAAIAD